MGSELDAELSSAIARVKSTGTAPKPQQALEAKGYYNQLFLMIFFLNLLSI